MDDHGFLLQALVYLAGAALFVPLFQRVGLGSVIGYLAAGIAIGPWGLRLITGIGTVRQLSELGVVLLLFLVGLELNPARLWGLRRSIFATGTLQVVLTIALVAAVARAFGVAWPPALAIGAAAAMSSTAIALQALADRNQAASPPGQAAFAVALFQDLAFVPLLLGVSLLSPGAEHGDGMTWRAVAVGVAAIAAMVLGGRLLLRPLLRWVAATGMREVFIAFALALIVGSAWLTASIGLSMAMGAFIAGVLLADSEYRMELEVDIDPFKGLLLGLFFMAVGTGIDIGRLASEPLLIAALVAGALVLKIALLVPVSLTARLCREDSWIFALALSQVGEFAFVLLAQAQAGRLLAEDVVARLNAAVALSMLATPLLFLAFDRWIAPRWRRTAVARAPDTIDELNPVIVAGAGRFGQVVMRLLHARGIRTTLIDHDPNQIALLGRFGWRAYYGDARRPDVLQAAGIARARLLILALDDPKAVRATAEYVRRHHPELRILARARGRTDAIELERAGVTTVRETFGSALIGGERALTLLGVPAAEATRAMRRFRAHDEALFQQQLSIRDEAQLIAMTQQGRRDLERLLRAEADAGYPADHAPARAGGDADAPAKAPVDGA